MLGSESNVPYGGNAPIERSRFMGIAGLIVVVVLVLFVVVLIYKSVHLIGPTEVGLVNKRFAFRKLPADNPIAFHHEAGFQSELLMPGLAHQALADLRGAEAPVGPGAGGRDRRGDRAGRRRAADRREERRVPGRVRQLLGPAPVHRARWPEGRAASGAPAGDADAGPPRRVPRAHPAGGLRPAGRARPRGREQGVRRHPQPDVARARPRAAARRDHCAAGPARHGGHRHRPRGRAAGVRRHREPARWLRRHRGRWKP